MPSKPKSSPALATYFTVEWWGSRTEKKVRWDDFKVQFVENGLIEDSYAGPIESCLDFIRELYQDHLNITYDRVPLIPWTELASEKEDRLIEFRIVPAKRRKL